ncbi:HAD-IC family P-type ATPase [Gemmiger formicilis]|uniref:HAD-IC family P-type ATPase n=1 Tax=Gemmiger formicilis TaxID=745368 RepID=UPI003CEF33F6
MSKATLLDSRIKQYAYRETAQIYRDIGASPDGLSTDQVEIMREKYGTNSSAGRRDDTLLRRLRRAFINPFNVTLFILGIISLVTDVLQATDFSKNTSTAIIIFSMILISGTIRLIQELRAKNAARQLDRLIHESITVKRGGELLEIPAEKLVVGDVVLLSAGNRVPADIRLTKVTDLFVSQAAITGESAILEKSSRTLGHGSPRPLTQLENLAFMATTVISGKGEGIVLAVGKDTLYGSFAKPDAEDKTSFQQGANSIAWVMIRFIAVLIPFVFILLGITGGNWFQSFAFALSVAVGLMPEMLPMVITACLARGSLSMSRKQTIIKDINAKLTPDQKARVVSVLRENGHTVGFMGDGINDAAAMKAADIGISVDTAVDVAKESADIILLEKDLMVLEQGIIEGRKTYANMIKYIKMTASSNFGNMFSVLAASALLPFLPMMSVHLIFLNLIYDLSCTAIPWDNVDEEFIAKPRKWDASSVGNFMIWIGPTSSIFDFTTYIFMYFVFCPLFVSGGVLFNDLAAHYSGAELAMMQAQYIGLFQAGWFVESMWSQTLVIHMIRTPKLPFIQSRASAPVTLLTMTGIAVLTIIPFTPLGAALGFVALPAAYFAYLIPCILLYMVLATSLKKAYVRHYGELL